MNVAKCPYLPEVNNDSYCHASTLRNQIPGDLQKDKYCMTEDHYRCPTFIVRVLVNRCRHMQRVGRKNMRAS